MFKNIILQIPTDSEDDVLLFELQVRFKSKVVAKKRVEEEHHHNKRLDRLPYVNGHIHVEVPQNDDCFFNVCLMQLEYPPVTDTVQELRNICRTYALLI